MQLNEAKSNQIKPNQSKSKPNRTKSIQIGTKSTQIKPNRNQIESNRIKSEPNRIQSEPNRFKSIQNRFNSMLINAERISRTQDIPGLPDLHPTRPHPVWLLIFTCGSRSTCGSFLLNLLLLTNVPKQAKTTIQITENRLT